MVRAAGCYHDVKHGLPRPLVALFSVIKAHLSRRFSPSGRRSNASRWRRNGRRTQFRDEPQDFSKQTPWYRNLRHLERDVPGMHDDLGANILTSFSLRLVSDQCATVSGNASVRMKLARL